MQLSPIDLRALGKNYCNHEPESISTTYSNSFAHRLCSLSPQSRLLLSSSEHSLSSRAIIESSLFFTDGDLCSNVSQYHDEPIASCYLVEFQECIERRLNKKKSVISVKGGKKLEITYGEVGDSIVDRLLLRYLSCRELYSVLKIVLTHLVVDDSLSKSFDEFRHLSGIPSLIHEPSRRAFRQ